MTNKNLLKILFIEDVPSDSELAVLELLKEGLRFEHIRVDTREEFIKALKKFSPDIIISDYMMPTYNGMQALKDAHDFDAAVPFILFTGSMNEETAVNCLKAGATDYVIKEHLARLPFAVIEALEQKRLQIEKRVTELLLKENEEKLQSIFSAAPVGIGLMVNRVFMEVNDTFCKIMGYNRKELIGKSSDLVYASKEEFESDGNEKYRQISEKGIGSVETRFKCKNGKILNILLSSAPLDRNDLKKGVTFTALDITQKKVAEEEILKKDRQLSSIYDTVDDVIYHLAVESDENYRFISVNHAFSSVTGLSEEMVIGKLVNKVIPQPSLSMVLGKYRQAIKEKSIIRWEEVSDYPNGRLTGDVSISPVFDDKGRCTHLVGSVHDITKRKLVEEALQKSQHLFQTLANVSPVGIFRTDPDGHTTYINPKWAELSGLTLEEAAGFKWLNAVHPDDKEKLKDNWLSNLSSQKKSNAEYRFLRPDGSIIWVMGNAVPEWIDKKIVGYIGTITDITERKQAEEKLKNSEERFKILYDQAPDAYYLSDLKGTFIDGNIAAEKLMGYSKNELIGKSFLKLKLLSLKQLPKAAILLVKNSLGQSTGPDEFELSRKDGSKITIEIITHPVKIKDRTLVLGLGRDITERRRADEVLRESETSLRNAQEIAKMGSWEWDLITQKTKWSDNYFAIHGLKSDEVEPSFELFRSRIHPDDVHFLDEIQTKIMKDKTSQSFEVRIIQNNGNVKWIQNYISPVIEDDKLVKLKGVIIDITGRKQAEEILHESEEKYRRIFENVQDMFFEASIEEIMLEVSPSIELISKGQYKRDEVIGKSMFDFINDPEEGEVLMNVLRERGFVSDLEIILKNRDGSHIPCAISSKIIFNAQGRPEKIIGSIRDITDRKRADLALIESEIKYRQLVTQSPDGIFVVDLSGKFLSVNTSICESLKYTEEELLSRNLLEIVPEKYHALHKQRLSAIINGESSTSKADYEVTGKDGANHFIEVLSVPYYKENKLAGFQGIARDITERKRVDKLLRENEEKYRRIFENVQDLYYETLMEGTIIEISPSIKAMSKGQYNREDLIGKSMYDFYPDANERDALITQIKEKGFVSDFEITLKNKDGSTVPCTISSKICFDAQGRPEKILGSARDITERKNATEKLRNAKEKAEESDRLKTAFLHNISHEIRTPMNAIVGFSALLSEPDIDEVTRASFVETITQSSNHLLAIINDIIEISNIEAGIVKIARDEININKVLQRLFDQFNPKAIEKGIGFDKVTPLPDKEALITSDNTKFIQVVANLLSNAFKFTDKGMIKFGYVPADQFINFYVSDSGIGIQEEQYQRIFDRFYQVEHSMERHFEGTGLGLSISKAFIEMMGGKIWVESELGKGSTFYFSLPCSIIRQFVKPVPSSGNEITFDRHMTILVAEDDENNYTLIFKFLTNPNLTMVRAKNGKEAVEYCQSGQPVDLILMDLKMPEMDGYEATAAIKKLAPAIPIIVQTAYVADKDLAWKSGCNDIITKPFKKKDLLEIVKKYIAN